MTIINPPKIGQGLTQWDLVHLGAPWDNNSLEPQQRLSRTPTKGTIVFDIYKSIANNPPNIVQELTQ